MMNFFPTGEVPEAVQSQDEYPKTDVASFEEIYVAAQLVECYCLGLHQIPGWASAGESSYFRFLLWRCWSKICHVRKTNAHDVSTGAEGGIGVFVWSTESFRNREVPPGIRPLSLPSSFDRLFNGSFEPDVDQAA